MSPAATALIQEVMLEMQRCQEYGLSAPLTRWIGMLQQAGEGAQTVSIDDDIYWDKNRKTVAQPMSENFARLIEDAQQLPPPEWKKPRIAVDVTPLAASSARAGSERQDDKLLAVVGIWGDHWSRCSRRDIAKCEGCASSVGGLVLAYKERLASVPAVAAPSVGAAPQREDRLVEAAKRADWMQVVLNQGPPCFHLEDKGNFCLRAERWAGHGVGEWPMHKFVNLADLLRGAALDAPEQP